LAEQRTPGLFPAAIQRPFFMTVMAGGARRVLAWDVSPATAGLEHMQDPIQDRAILIPWTPAATLHIGICIWKQRFNDCPLRIAQFVSAHADSLPNLFLFSE
jgi:hypothetical protein